MRMLMAALFLTLALPACAQPNASQTQTLEQRDTWQNSLAVVREGLDIQVERNGRVEDSHWVLLERTPNHRLRILVKDTPEAEHELTFLVQGKRTLALMGEDVTAPAAPWVLGFQLFDEPLEPSMLVSWTLGVPGKSFSMNSGPANVVVKNGLPESLAQDGWTVTFEDWWKADGATPALPQRLRACKNDTCLAITMIGIETYKTPPKDYNEFRIM